MQAKFVKFTALLAVALLVVCAVAPKVIGLTVRQFVVADALALLPPETRALISVEEIGYQAGWFRSTAQVDLSYAPFAGYDALTTRTSLDIQHGPLLFTRNGLALGLVYAVIEPQVDSADVRAFLADMPFALPATHIDLLTRFNGDTQLRVDVDAVAYSATDGEFVFDGLQFSLIAHTDQSTESTLAIGRLDAREAGSAFDFRLQDLHSTANSLPLGDSLATGSMQFAVGRLSSASPYPFALQDLRSASGLHSTDNGARLALMQQLSIAAIDSDLPLSAFDLSLTLGELQPAFLRRAYTLANDVQVSANANPGLLTPVMTEALGEAGLLVLQNPLTVDSSFRADAWEGDHSVDLGLRWEGLPDLAELARLDLRAALAALNITLDMSLDLEAITRSPLAEFIDPYVQEGYLQLDNGRIILQARLENLTIQLNDQTMSADELF